MRVKNAGGVKPLKLSDTVATLEAQGYVRLNTEALLIDGDGNLASVAPDGSYITCGHISDARRSAGIGKTGPVEFHADGNLKG